MKQPTKKRIKLEGGWYYPQYKFLCFWCHYDDESNSMHTATTAVLFRSEHMAMAFLAKKHDVELAAIQMKKDTAIIAWTPSK